MSQKSFKHIYVQMIADYEERLRSLRSDGYQLRFDTDSKNFRFASLRHMANGNRITLSLNFQARTLRQYTNHVLTHFQEYTASI